MFAYEVYYSHGCLFMSNRPEVHLDYSRYSIENEEVLVNPFGITGTDKNFNFLYPIKEQRYGEIDMISAGVLAKLYNRTNDVYKWRYFRTDIDGKIWMYYIKSEQPLGEVSRILLRSESRRRFYNEAA